MVETMELGVAPSLPGLRSFASAVDEFGIPVFTDGRCKFNDGDNSERERRCKRPCR